MICFKKRQTYHHQESKEEEERRERVEGDQNQKEERDGES